VVGAVNMREITLLTVVGIGLIIFYIFQFRFLKKGDSKFIALAKSFGIAIFIALVLSVILNLVGLR